MKDEDKRLLHDTPDHHEWSAAVFDSARRLARSGEDVPAHAFLMLEAARQYHMAQITRLERFLTSDVLDSEQVVDLAIKRLSVRPEAGAKADCKHRWFPETGDGVIKCIFCQMFGERVTSFTPQPQLGEQYK